MIFVVDYENDWICLFVIGVCCVGILVMVEMDFGCILMKYSDIIMGIVGDDIIYVGVGYDLVCVGDGNDMVFGSLGDDLIFG